ncbi:unnamed protein product [Ceratitis capitata]|uniref:(Mediterranean fruit fly) hypothetical protein n=1 Tax=Ceratitis capitata TaxID=7213 RepID=A0A811V391_CERCA|nr:unnamed protein product [Ceratitis capitata]
MEDEELDGELAEVEGCTLQQFPKWTETMTKEPREQTKRVYWKNNFQNCRIIDLYARNPDSETIDVKISQKINKLGHHVPSAQLSYAFCVLTTLTILIL